MEIPHPEEILEVIDSDQNVIRLATRKEIHNNNLLHREVWIIIENSKNQILLSKLARHDIWDASCAGHVEPGATWTKGAIRELKEELDIDAEESDLSYLGILKTDKPDYNPTNNVLAQCYKLKWNGKINFNDNELKEAKWFTLDEIKNIKKSDMANRAVLLINLFKNQ